LLLVLLLLRGGGSGCDGLLVLVLLLLESPVGQGIRACLERRVLERRMLAVRT
jgi:hypothetical protein